MNALGIDIGGTSVKIAMLRDGQPIWTAQSKSYDRPDTQQLIESIRQAASGNDVCADAVGLCVPGILDQKSRTITLATNVPGLIGIPLDDLLTQSRPSGPGFFPPARIINDGLAAATDFNFTRKSKGRLLAIVIGTGVGACVLDDGIPLRIDGDSPGHLGQLDVSLDDRIGSDGGAGSLEAYIGARAIQSIDAIDDLQLRALSRAIRICHAIYRPHHIALLGGIGTRLQSKLETIRALVNQNLTSVARENWTLQCGDDDFHAARGAARIALSRAVQRSPS